MQRFSFAARTASLFLAFSSVVSTGSGRAAGAPTLENALDEIQSYAAQAMRVQGTPGLSVAITDRTHTLRIITVGYANVETRAPVTAQTRFAIGSITKSMTALALLQLHDAGRLDLNAPVTQDLPWFSIESGRQTVLVHEILSHAAGLPDDYAAEPG